MSTADTARQVQGFLSATSRPRCGNCKHGKETIAERMPPFDTRSWRCIRGGFSVTAGAICAKHEPDFQTGQTTKAAAPDA